MFLGFSRDKVSLVATVFFSQAYLFCRNISFFGSLTICLARFVVLSILCSDNLMCDTGIVMLRHQKLCRNSVSMQLLQIDVAIQFLCRESISVGSCCNNVSCIVNIPIATRKFRRDRVLYHLT